MLAHQSLHRHQRLIPHVRILMAHQFHHTRLAVQVVNDPTRTLDSH